MDFTAIVLTENETTRILAVVNGDVVDQWNAEGAPENISGVLIQANDLSDLHTGLFNITSDYMDQLSIRLIPKSSEEPTEE